MNKKLYKAIKCDTDDNFIEYQSKITDEQDLKDTMSTINWKGIFGGIINNIKITRDKQGTLKVVLKKGKKVKQHGERPAAKPQGDEGNENEDDEEDDEEETKLLFTVELLKDIITLVGMFSDDYNCNNKDVSGCLSEVHNIIKGLDDNICGCDNEEVKILANKINL